MKKYIFLLLVLFISIALAGCSSVASGSAGEEKAYKMVVAHSTAESTSFDRIMKYFKEQIEEKSEGKIEVQIYPNAQLGADRELIEGVQAGDITISLHSTAPAVNFVDDVAVFDVPFLFPDKEVARSVMDVDGAFFEKISESQAEKGFKLLGLHDQGFRQLTVNNVKVASPEDLKGIRLRTMENEFHMETWRQLGGNPTPLPFNEVYTALQQGTVDGQENPLELIVSQRFYEQQDYLVETNHILQTIQVIMNLEYFNDLPEDLQVMVEETMAEAVETGNQFIDEKEAEYSEIMKDAGMEFIELTPEELGLFQEETESVLNRISGVVNEDVLNTLLEEVEKQKQK